MLKRLRFWLDLQLIYRRLASAQRDGQALLCLGRGIDSPERGVLLR